MRRGGHECQVDTAEGKVTEAGWVLRLCWLGRVIQTAIECCWFSTGSREPKVHVTWQPPPKDRVPYELLEVGGLRGLGQRGDGDTLLPRQAHFQGVDLKADRDMRRKGGHLEFRIG